MGIDFLQRWVPSIDEVAQILNRRWLVLNKNQQQMEAQGRQRLTITCLVNRTDVWDSLKKEKRRRVNTAQKSETKIFGANSYIAGTIVAQHKIEQGHEEVLGILAAPIGQECTERIQDDQVLIWRVEQGLGKQCDHKAHQSNSVLIKLRLMMIRSLHDGNSRFPHELFIDTSDRRRRIIVQLLDGEAWHEEE